MDACICIAPIYLFYPYLNELKAYLMEVIFKCSNFMDNVWEKRERESKRKNELTELKREWT